MLSLLEALSSGSKDYSDSPVWTFLNDHGDPVDSYTYLVRLMFPHLYFTQPHHI